MLLILKLHVATNELIREIHGVLLQNLLSVQLGTLFLPLDDGRQALVHLVEGFLLTHVLA
jgi:hypothetical protein